MADPVETLRRKISYKIVQRLDNSAGTGFTINLNPFSFPYSGMCKVHLRSISLSGFTATPTTLLVNLDVSQPYSQSNISGQTPAYNNNKTIYASQVDAAATTFNETDMISTHVFATLAPTSTIRIEITDATGIAYVGNYVGVIILEISPVNL
jgi:hypothetical protein